MASLLFRVFSRGLSGNRGAALFDERVAVLRRFIREHERLPHLHERFEGFHIGAWAHTVRHRRVAGMLSAQRIAQIEAAVGPQWMW